MATDLSKILSVSGQRALYQYLAQARNGVIAESLADKKRALFSMSSKMTTLADISIYTSEEEMKLADVFTALKNTLDGGLAPDAKSPEAELVALFTKAIPNYDADRFYVSHMRKVVEWYNQLQQYASLEFTTEE